MATRRKSSSKRAAARKRTAPRSARPRARGARSKAARRKAAGRAGTSIESLARKIVRATTGDPAKVRIADLYAEGAVSREATGQAVTGIAGLEAKLRQWESMQDSRAARWKPRSVLAKGNTICIEWEADLKMRDGRSLTFQEVAVHEVKNGKIVAERYYYNPLSLAPAAGAGPAATPRPSAG